MMITKRSSGNNRSLYTTYEHVSASRQNWSGMELGARTVSVEIFVFPIPQGLSIQFRVKWTDNPGATIGSYTCLCQRNGNYLGISNENYRKNSIRACLVKVMSGVKAVESVHISQKFPAGSSTIAVCKSYHVPPNSVKNTFKTLIYCM